MDHARELISFTKNLYYLTRMGAPLSETFKTIRNNIASRDMGDAVKDIQRKVEEGKSLSEAMSSHVKLFPPDYVKMIEVAESTETLPQVLRDLAAYLEAVEIARRNIQAAAMYPGLVINFSFLFVLTVWFFAAPVIFNQYVGFINSMGKTLPPITWFFIATGKFIFSPIFMAIMLAGILVLDFAIFTRSAIGTNFLLRLPIVRDIFRKSYIARISRALGFMLKQGIAMDLSLNLVAKTAESSIVEEILKKAEEQVRQGKLLSEAFKGAEIFDNTFIFMIKNGEEREDLPSALFDAADYYEDDLKGFYTGFFRLIEPAFLATVGLIVGFMIVSLFLPFYSLTSAINR